MQDFLHVVPIRDETKDAQYLYPALGWRHRNHQGGRVRPQRSPARATVMRWRNRHVYSFCHTLRADHERDRDRRAAWTCTQCTVNAEEQTSFRKWTNKDDRGEVANFAEWSWFRTPAEQSKLAEQWEDAHWVGMLKRADEHLLVFRGMTRTVIAGRRHVRDEKWNLGSVKAVLNRT